MNRELYNKYGIYNSDGFFIMNHSKWDYYAKNPSDYKRLKMLAFSLMLIPIIGVLLCGTLMEKAGLSII